MYIYLCTRARQSLYIKRSRISQWKQLGVKNLAQGPTSEIILLSLRFEPATFRSQGQPANPLICTLQWLTTVASQLQSCGVIPALALCLWVYYF